MGKAPYVDDPEAVWVSDRPGYFKTVNITPQISVYKDFNSRNLDIYMSLSILGIHRHRLKSADLEDAKVEALKLYRQILVDKILQVDSILGEDSPKYKDLADIKHIAITKLEEYRLTVMSDILHSATIRACIDIVNRL